MLRAHSLRRLLLFVGLTTTQIALLQAQQMAVTTLAGAAARPGSTNGVGNQALFYLPYGIAADSAGNVYVADTGNQLIRKIAPDSSVTTLAGRANQSGTNNGVGGEARFNSPQGLALDSATNVYVADTGNNLLRKITPDGTVSTLAGSAFQPGRTDGTGEEARFFTPTGLALDSVSNLYVADRNNVLIRKVTPDGTVSTLAGTTFAGTNNGTGTNASFRYPRSLAVDNAGNVYVADTDGAAIRRITPAGVVTTLAGSPGVTGTADGTGSTARFAGPSGISYDRLNNVFYVADTANNTIRRMTTNGTVTTVAGTAGNSGIRDGIGTGAQFWFPNGVTVDGAGNVYVADTANHTIRKGVIGGVLQPPVITVQPEGRTVLEGTNVAFTVLFTGSAPLGFQWRRNNATISGATSATLTISNVLTSQAGLLSVVVTNSAGSVTSAVAVLTVIPVPPPANDSFSNRIVLTGSSITANGSNQGATKEQSEPNHAANSGGRSVWWSWTAPTNGVVTIDTVGSSFDTLLAVYAGAALSTSDAIFRLVAAENDTGDLSGGASRVNFFATAGVEYQIAVDGVAGANGTVALRLSVTSADASPPIILTQPRSTNLVAGGTATFTVLATGNPTYQWRKDDTLVGTNATLVLSNVVSSQAGNYRALVSNASGSVLSSNAVLTVIPAAAPYVPAANQTELVVRQTNGAATATVIVTFPSTGYSVVNWGTANRTNNIFTADASFLTPSANVAVLPVLTPVTNSYSLGTLTNGGYGFIFNSRGANVRSTSFTITNATPIPATRMVRAVSTNGTPGSTIVIPIQLVSLGTENALSFSLSYNPSILSNLQVALGSGAINGNLTANISRAAEGRIGLLLLLPASQTFRPGTQEVAQVSFAVNAATTAESTTITFGNDPVDREINDANAGVLTAEYVSSTLTISRGIEADVRPVPNGDGRVSTLDLVQITRFAAGLDTITDSFEFQRADSAPRATFGDGRISLSDAVQAARYAAGLDPLVPAAGPTNASPTLAQSSSAGGVTKAKLTPEIGLAAVGSTRQVRAKDFSILPGQTNTLVIELDAQGDENALGFSVSFDAAVLRYVRARLGTGANSASYQVNEAQAAAGRVGVVMNLGANQTWAAGTRPVFEFDFAAVSPTATSTTTVSLADDPVLREVVSATPSLLTSTYASGTIMVNPIIVGVTRSANRLVLSWPASAAGYILETSGSLGGGASWSAPTVGPTTVGDRLVLTNDLGTTARFFRLRKP